MQHKLSDWQRLESVIKWANMTTNYFARHIGIPKAETLYRIKRGQNGISEDVAKRVTAAFPQINIVWLKMGYGEMFGNPEDNSSAKPLYNLGVEESIRNIDSIEPSDYIVLPPMIDYDLAMLYLGRAMGLSTPTNTVVLLKKILPEMIIPGDECVIVTKKIVLLRIATLDQGQNEQDRLRLIAADRDNFGDVIVDLKEIEAVYKIKSKILTNN